MSVSFVISIGNYLITVRLQFKFALFPSPEARIRFRLFDSSTTCVTITQRLTSHYTSDTLQKTDVLRLPQTTIQELCDGGKDGRPQPACWNPDARIIIFSAHTTWTSRVLGLQLVISDIVTICVRRSTGSSSIAIDCIIWAVSVSSDEIKPLDIHELRALLTTGFCWQAPMRATHGGHTGGLIMWLCVTTVTCNEMTAT